MRIHRLIAATALMVIASCVDDPAGGDPSGTPRIELAPDSPTLEAIGEIVPMQARVFRADGTEVTRPDVAWATSAPRVASIDKSGLVQATGDGTATVTASWGGTSAATTITVHQRIEGLAFDAGPKDAVAGASSGEVTIIVRDPLGAPVARAAGAVTLASVAGSPGTLVGGPRTAPLQNGRARFADVRVTGEGVGYRLQATWEASSVTSLPFSVVPGLDFVALVHAPAGERGLLIDGFGSGRQLNDVTVRSAADTVAVGIFTSMLGSQDEVVAFGPGRRPAMLRPVRWTTGIDTVPVPMDGPVALDVTVWIVKGPVDTTRARAGAALDTTLAIWTDQNAGLVFDSVEVVDATADPDAPRFFDLTLCNSQSGLESLIGKRSGRINIYYVGTVDGGTDRGRACPIGGDHAIMAERSGHELLSHEIGHLLSLVHTDGITNLFDQSNVMHSASSQRHYLTEGQVFRQQFDTNSALNRLFGIRTAEARPCPSSSATTTCPAIEHRIWADGIFPPTTGATDAAAALASVPASMTASPRDIVRSWLLVKCEMDRNEGLGARMRQLGDPAVHELVRAFRDGPDNPYDDAGRWRRSALDGLAWIRTPAATAALDEIAENAPAASLRVEAASRLRRIRAASLQQ